LTLIPVILGAETRWERQVRGQIDAVTAKATELGYVRSGQSFSGELRATASESVTLTLDETREHIIVGVCDNDCSDMDLALSEMSGGHVVADRDGNDVPILEVASGHKGAHRLTITMASCTTAPCRYAIAVYSR
jgi:hypothetical protein